MLNTGLRYSGTHNEDIAQHRLSQKEQNHKQSNMKSRFGKTIRNSNFFIRRWLQEHLIPQLVVSLPFSILQF
jgi:hypothetical protein